jgi:hypothetical protein
LSRSSDRAVGGALAPGMSRERVQAVAQPGSLHERLC